MKKLFSFLLLTTYTSIFTNISDKSYVKRDGETWKVCKEIEHNQAKCNNINDKIPQLLKVLSLVAKNEELAKELIKNILIAETLYENIIAKDNLQESTIEPHVSQEEQDKAEEEFKRENPCLMNHLNSLFPNYLRQWLNNPKDLEFINSLLSEEEQKMFFETIEMRKKIEEKQLVKENNN